MTRKQLIDSTGNIYESISEFCRRLGFPQSTVKDALIKYGVFSKGGVSVTYNREDVKTEAFKALTSSIEEEKLLGKIKDRYSKDELKILAKGASKKELSYPEIKLKGAHHKLLVMADTHLGSKYTPIEWIEEAFKEGEAQGCEAVLHLGDIVEGLTPRRIATQIYELTHIGYKAQRDLAVEVFSKCNLPIYAISGNHDMYFNEYAGANIVEDIAQRVPNMHYLGHDEADITINGATIRLFHGGDANSYALSYRLQKLVESITGGKKPNIFLAGHVHKFCYIFERMIHAVSVPCLQMQTGFMRGKRIAAHTGFLIISFDTDQNGVNNFKVKFYPYYG